MKPYYEDNRSGIAIYHGDCRDVLPGVQTDLVLTDPPYGIRYVTSWRSRVDKLCTPVMHDKDLSVVEDALPRILGTLTNDRHWYMFASPRMIADAQKMLTPYGMKQIIAWDKGDRGTVGDLEAGFGEAWEAIFYGMKGRRQLYGSRPRSVIRYDWSSTLDPVHPTVKPVPLLQRLILLSTREGEMVFDPFMGSGTTLRAAKNLGRKAIGIEIEERYCEIAARRLSQEVMRFDEV